MPLIVPQFSSDARRATRKPEATLPIAIHTLSSVETLNLDPKVIECCDQSREWHDDALPQNLVPVAEP